MPIYDYLCDCGYVTRDFETISKRKKEIKCEQCGKMSPRTYANPTRCDGGDKPRVSRAMGIRPEDIPNARKKWPGSEYDKTGALIIRSRAEKKIRLRQRGFIEY